MAEPASRISLNTLKTRVIPIIFVPGIMGSRLSFADDDIDWDPNSSLKMMKWLHKSAEEKAKILHYKNKAKVIGEDSGRGWDTVAKDFYESFLKSLADQKFAKTKSPVYAVGFDWRQSCEDSGTYLATKINRVMEREKTNKVIVITHSMGGLVARSAIQKTKGLMDSVIGVAHVAQPVAGAVALYRRLFTGMLPDWDGGTHLSQILGNTPYDFILPMSGIPGVFELLPTQQYRYIPDKLPSDADMKLIRGPWESAEKGYKDGMGRTAYPSGISSRYLGADGPPGLFNQRLHGSRNPADTQRTKSMVEAGIRAADRFHRSLGLFLHRNTWALHSTGKDTDVAVRYPVDNMNPDFAYRTTDGDGTVPADSAAALFAESFEGTVENVQVYTQRQFFIRGADHGQVFDHEAARKAVFQMVYQMIQYNN